MELTVEIKSPASGAIKKKKTLIESIMEKIGSVVGKLKKMIDIGRNQTWKIKETILASRIPYHPSIGQLNRKIVLRLRKKIREIR